MRTRKKHEETRNAMIEKTWTLFLDKGYEKCTMAVILRYLDISKGEFYHYFQSKEDCAKACADYYASQCVQKVTANIQPSAKPFEKIMNLISQGNKIAQENDINKIDSVPNQVFHQMLMGQLVKQLAPVYESVIVEGNQSGEWDVSAPLESAEMFLTLTNFYLDSSIFEWKEDQMMQKIKACSMFLGNLLGKQKEIELMFKTYER